MKSNKISKSNFIDRNGLFCFVEYFLWIMGLILLGFYLSLVSIRKAASEIEVEKFITQLETETQPKPTKPDLSYKVPILDHDKSLWSEQRIKAYAFASELISARPTRGVLSIPSLELKAPIYEGVDEVVLNKGLGWIPDTASIGTRGNVGIAGHRDSFFRVLKDINKNDIIEVVGTNSSVRYKVTDTFIVTPDAVHVLDETTQPVLTLVTCYPFYYVGHAPKRFIVRAVAIDSL